MYMIEFNYITIIRKQIFHKSFLFLQIILINFSLFIRNNLILFYIMITLPSIYYSKGKFEINLEMCYLTLHIGFPLMCKLINDGIFYKFVINESKFFI